MLQKGPAMNATVHALLAILLLATAGFANTPAGTVITNQAIGKLGDAEVTSNQVTTVVQAICRPSLSPEGTVDAAAYLRTVQASRTTYLPYVLTNAGNGTFTFSLTPEQTGGDWNAALALHYDMNGNGALEPNEGTIDGVTLAQGHTAHLLLAVTAPADAEGEVTVNLIAACPSGELTDDHHVIVQIDNQYTHHLGPQGNPRALPGGEGSASDHQSIDALAWGHPRCFVHTLENTSAVTDTYTVTVTTPPLHIQSDLRTMDFAPLPASVTLSSESTLEFLHCVTATGQAGPFTATLTARSQSSQQSNATINQVHTVINSDPLELIKTASAEGAVDEDQELTYTLTLRNTSPVALTNLQVQDTLQPFTRATTTPGEPELRNTFSRASHAGTYDASNHTVTWHLPRLESGESIGLTVVVRTPTSIPVGAVYALDNTFRATSDQLTQDILSNTVTTHFPILALLIDKTTRMTSGSVGDSVTYTLKVTNPTEISMAISIIDEPPAQTAYVQGSAVVTLGTLTTPLEPTASETTLTWNATPELTLELGPRGSSTDTLTVVYALRLLPGASGTLINYAQAQGTAFNGTANVTVNSNHTNVQVQVQENAFNEPRALLSGRVYLDLDMDDQYTHEVDQPLEGARLVLSNGWQTVTDTEGRYAFRELLPGTWLVLLDEQSAPFPPREYR
jgi:uncharacterized repeat protein (TIGR01451 family)/fimbrial isopeptide formation D2 family protein